MSAFTDPWTHGISLEKLYRELAISRTERLIAYNLDWTEAELNKGKNLQYYMRWKTLQESADAICLYYFDDEATFTEFGAIPWFTLATFRERAGLDEDGWRRAREWDGVNDPTWLTPGVAEPGDIIGPWVIADLQKAFAALKMIPMRNKDGATSVFSKMQAFNDKIEAEPEKWIDEYGYKSFEFDPLIQITWDYKDPDTGLSYPRYFGGVEVETGVDLDMTDMGDLFGAGGRDYSSFGLNGWSSYYYGVGMIVDSAVNDDVVNCSMAVSVSGDKSAIFKGLSAGLLVNASFTAGPTISGTSASFSGSLERKDEKEGYCAVLIWAVVEPEFSYDEMAE